MIKRKAIEIYCCMLLELPEQGSSSFLYLLSTLGGWHPDANRALCSVATAIAARGLPTFSRARSILFRRHADLLVANNAICLMLSLTSEIGEEALVTRNMQQ